MLRPPATVHGCIKRPITRRRRRGR
jgi:hypothetical protein